MGPPLWMTAGAAAGGWELGRGGGWPGMVMMVGCAGWAGRLGRYRLFLCLGPDSIGKKILLKILLKNPHEKLSKNYNNKKSSNMKK